MKKFATYLFLAGSLAFSSCSDDYLETAPQSSVSKSDLFATPDNAQYAVNGLGRVMCTQYLDTQGYNGEGTVYAYGSEWCGDGAQVMNRTGFSNLIRSNYNTSNNNNNTAVHWYYYYKLIGNTNQILENIVLDDEDPENARKWDYVRAQALVYRAYAYTMLSQLYCRRWTDRNGDQRGLPLRLDTKDTPIRAASMAQVYKRIYKDLDEAISLFESCGLDRDKSERWKASADVAHAVYSRAALIRNDWDKVISESQAARKNYPLMTASEYKEGFNTANSEWIWEVFEDETQPMHYYTFFNYMSSSCAGSHSRTYPILISKQIVDPINPDDARLAIYGIPTEKELPEASAKKLKDSGNVTKGDFYTRIKNEFKGRLYSTTKIAYYIATKFIVKANVGDGCIPIFRSAEMLYNEAEAQLRKGNESAARVLLEEAVAPYQSNYTCDKSGQALWDELKAYRKFDLFSEGHSWFDLKRWGDNMVRKTWAEGGSWHPTFAGGEGETSGNYGPTAKNHWTHVFPRNETNYNNLVTTFEEDNWTTELSDDEI